MLFLVLLWLSRALPVGSAQSPLPAVTGPQRIVVATGVVAAGRSLTAWIDVTPKPNMHVYAQGAKGFDPLTLTVAPQPGVTAGRTKYPAAELMASPGTLERVPVYGQPFRITQPLKISATVKRRPAVVTGILTYQACDDRLCYPTQSVAVSWSLPGS